jgi:pimeloyl-ACP methyl ester carboxylesterase
MALVLTRAERVPLARTPEAYGLSYERVSFPSQVDRLPLNGWLIAPPADLPQKRVVISVHGKGGNRENGPGGGSLEISAQLARHGHPVLALDLRGAGESGGTRFTLGALETRDVAGALDYLEQRGLAADGVNLLGYSMGAATAMLVGASDPRVRAVAEDAGFADLRDVLDQQIPKQSGLPPMFTPGTVLMARTLLGVDAYGIRPIDGLPALAARGVPLLAIHGEADSLIPIHHGQRLAAAYGPGAETHFVPGAGHVRSYVTDPDTYTRRLLDFLGRAA